MGLEASRIEMSAGWPEDEVLVAGGAGISVTAYMDAGI